MELLYEPMGGPGSIPMKDPGQGSPALMTPAFVVATSTPGEGQGGDYPRGAARDQRRDGPIQCWRCHGFGHTQSRCPNKKKPVDYTPLCRYCSGEGHFDEDCPKRRAVAGKEKGLGVFFVSSTWLLRSRWGTYARKTHREDLQGGRRPRRVLTPRTD
ncbi:hypothetical protein KP509_1Z124300 [Ceratopteris richardii]|nr:hypothetical protein KP509_1Z124300 [Ceratopteris richardii]